MADSSRIDELKRRVRSDPASIAFAALAEEYRRAGRFEEAIETCTAGIVRHPSYLSAHVTLGRALIEVGRLPEAREELEYVLKLAPENLAAIRGLAEIHHRTGEDASEHTEHYERADEAARAPAAAPPVNVAGMQAPSVTSSPLPSIAPDPIIDPPYVAAMGDVAAAYSEPPLAPARHAPSIAEAHPALAGLEEFLQAIVRARSGRAAAR